MVTRKLIIGGRDPTRLVERLLKQVAAVALELQAVSAVVPVQGRCAASGPSCPGSAAAASPGCRCWVGGGLGKLLRSDGDLQVGDRQVVGQYLGERFPAAVSGRQPGRCCPSVISRAGELELAGPAGR